MDKWKYSYLAGLVDGEGSICISKYFDKKSGKLRIQPHFEITTSDSIITPFLKENFNGCIIVRKRKIYNENWHDANMWMITGNDNIINILEQMLPYLQLKKEQAELMIEFCKSRNISFRKRREERYFTTREIEIYEKLKELHKF